MLKHKDHLARLQCTSLQNKIRLNSVLWMRKLVDLDLDLDSFWRTVFGSKLSKKNVSSFNGNLYFTMNGREKMSTKSNKIE